MGGFTTAAGGSGSGLTVWFDPRYFANLSTGDPYVRPQDSVTLNDAFSYLF
jgi:hypothetical protein